MDSVQTIGSVMLQTWEPQTNCVPPLHGIDSCLGSAWDLGLSGTLHMGSCQNYGPFLGTLNIRCRIILGTQKGTLILTTTHIAPSQTFGRVQKVHGLGSKAADSAL